MPNDLLYGRNGDFVLNINDFEDTNSYPKSGEDERQMVRSIVLSLQNDWRHIPLMTANLDKYVGAPNNKATADKVTAEVKAAIQKFMLISKDSLYVRTFPISREALAIYVELNFVDESGNTKVINELFTGPNSVSVNPKLVAAN